VRLTSNNEFQTAQTRRKKTQITAIFRYNVILIFRELNFFEAYSVQYSSRQLCINIFPKAIWEISFHAAIIFIHQVSLHTIKATKSLLSNVYNIVEKPTKTLRTLVSHLVRAPYSRSGGHGLEYLVRQELGH
jgi:hypothetical protein